MRGRRFGYGAVAFGDVAIAANVQFDGCDRLCLLRDALCGKILRAGAALKKSMSGRDWVWRAAVSFGVGCLAAQGLQKVASASQALHTLVALVGDADGAGIVHRDAQRGGGNG